MTGRFTPWRRQVHAWGCHCERMDEVEGTLVTPKEGVPLQTEKVTAIGHLTMLHEFAVVYVYKILNYCNSNEQIGFRRKKSEVYK